MNSACQSMVSGQLKVIGQFSLNSIRRKTRIKFVVDHWLLSIHLLSVGSVCSKSVCRFSFRGG